MKILIIVAHPDDEVLGMGGTILKHSKNDSPIITNIFKINLKMLSFLDFWVKVLLTFYFKFQSRYKSN